MIEIAIFATALVIIEGEFDMYALLLFWTVVGNYRGFGA